MSPMTRALQSHEATWGSIVAERGGVCGLSGYFEHEEQPQTPPSPRATPPLAPLTDFSEGLIKTYVIEVRIDPPFFGGHLISD